MSAPNERLRQARRRAGYRGPTEAARAFGWKLDSYKSHENGMRGIRLEVAEKYGKAFRVSPAWILTGEASGAPSIADDERAILEKFARLSVEGRRAVHALCDVLLNEIAPKPGPSRRSRMGSR